MKKIALHLGLFGLTVFTTLLAGAELVSGRSWLGGENSLSLADLHYGIAYSFAFLLFLSVHEFGHYFTAKFHRVRASLPYYIPVFIPYMLNIGSFGALIRLKQQPRSTREYFDIGIAGPLAGFVVAVGLLVYGFSSLPDPAEKIGAVHPVYETWFGGIPTEARQQEFWESGEIVTHFSPAEMAAAEAEYLSEAERELPAAERLARLRERYPSIALKVGKTLIFQLFESWIPDNPAWVPDRFELIHYPWLFVGFITLFFTALNLLPIGQLDGGHVIYGMFGQRVASLVSRVTVLGLLVAGGTGVFEWNKLDIFSWDYGILLLGYLALSVYAFHRVLRFPTRNRRPGHWRKVVLSSLLLWAFQIGFAYVFPGELELSFIWLLYAFLAVRFIGLDHPPAFHEHRVNLPRQILGWIAICIFILCFTLYPLVIVGG